MYDQHGYCGYFCLHASSCNFPGITSNHSKMVYIKSPFNQPDTIGNNYYDIDIHIIHVQLQFVILKFLVEYVCLIHSTFGLPETILSLYS